MSLLMSDDLPTLGLPTILTKPALNVEIIESICKGSLFFNCERPTFANVFEKGQLDQKCNDRGVEQLVARWAHNPKVTGSSPVPATKKKACEFLKFAGFFSITEEG